MSVLNGGYRLMPFGAERREIDPGSAAATRAERRDVGQARPAGLFSTCANPYCRAGWLRLWRRRETPVFEGGWCCSEECTRACAEAAVSREMMAWSGVERSLPHRIPLGLAMLEQGWISQHDLRAALAAQREAGAGRLGEWLVRHESATQEEVTRALGLQWSCPVLRVERDDPEELASLMPRFFVDAFGALPLRVAAKRIAYLGFEERPDPVLALALERMTGLKVDSGIVEQSMFRKAHARMLEARFPEAELIEAGSRSALAAVLTRVLEQTQPREARLVRVHDCLWLRLWKAKPNGPVPGVDAVRDLICSTALH